MANKTKDNMMRVFISSTFQDMNEIRSHLAINVFPYVRKNLFKRGINFFWIDLRWGITDEEAQAGLVVPKCLQSINDCNVFIGIIGDYYGTTLCKADIETLDLSEESKTRIIRYMDLYENSDGISITEIEMLHGVLYNHKIPNSCFFIKKSNGIEDPRIKRLVKKIKKGNYACHEFSTNEQLGRLLSNYLFEISPNYQGDYDEIQKEFKVQQAILDSYLNDYHADEEFEEPNRKLNRVKWDNNRGYFDYNRFYNNHNHAIAGKWGCGKSSYVSNWINRIEQTNEYNIVYYFINSSSSYNTPGEIANYLSCQILRTDEYRNKINVSVLPEHPVDRLHQLLSLTYLNISKPLVIVLDGVENLKDNTESCVYAKSLVWVGHVHPNVFFMISAERSDYSIAHFKDLKIDIQESPILKDDVVKELANHYLKQYHKTVNGNYLDKIAGCSIFKNPLLFRRFLDLLISCDNNVSLEESIETFSQVPTAQVFISLYFNRLLTYFPKCYKDLLFYLAVSRNGLYGLELGRLLQEDGVLPTNRIMEICAMLDDFLISSGVDNLIHTNCHIYIKNEIVKEAICNNLIDYDSTYRYRRKILDIIIKDHFVSTFGDGIHLYSELLHQLYELKEYGDLYNLLLIPDYFLKMRSSKDYIKYWTALYNQGCSLSMYFEKKRINNLSDKLFISYATKVLLLAQIIGNYADSAIVVQIVIDKMSERHLIDINQEGYFPNLSTKSTKLMTIIFEIANDSHIISKQIYSLYQPLLLTLQNKGEDIESRSYLHYYINVLYCETLIVIAGRNQETKIFNLLYKIIYNNTIEQKISYEQQQYIEMMANIVLLKLASISCQYYHKIITGTLDGTRNKLNEAIVVVSGFRASSKAKIALFYLYVFRNGMPVWNNDNEYLEKAINVLNEVEREGSVNVSRYLALCYSEQIKWYKNNNDNEKVVQYKALLRERLYDNNDNPQWDIPPYVWKEIEGQV